MAGLGKETGEVRACPLGSPSVSWSPAAGASASGIPAPVSIFEFPWAQTHGANTKAPTPKAKKKAGNRDFTAPLLPRRRRFAIKSLEFILITFDIGGIRRKHGVLEI